jgi:hypothetical protein
MPSLQKLPISNFTSPQRKGLGEMPIKKALIIPDQRL